MRLFPEEGYQRVLALLLYAAVALAVFYVAAHYLLPALLPFLIAALIAVLLRRPTLALAKQTRMPKKLVASLMAVLFACTLFGALAFLIRILFDELGDFVRAVLNGENALIENLSGLLSRLGTLIARIPLVGGETEELRRIMTNAVIDTAKNVAVSIGGKLPELAARFAAAVPQAVVFCAVTLFSCVYFCMDYDKITAFLRGHCHGGLLRAADKLRGVTANVLSGILRSYGILFLLTFSELLLGFLILRQPYAFLLALVTATVDALPVFGTGAVLLPMALYNLFVGNVRVAIGLCILYAAVTVARQIAEPKLLGTGLGIHPLLTLMTMYAGLKLFGILGMVLLPPVAVIVKNAVFPRRSS